MPSEKRNFYFSHEMLEEILQESQRQQCSISELMRRAWVISRDRIQQYPDSPDYAPQPKSRSEYE